MTKNSEMEAKVAILDKCCQSVECLARGKVFDLVGTLDLPQSSSPETESERAALVAYLDVFLEPNPTVQLSGLVCKHGTAIEACPSRECENPMAYETAIRRARDFIKSGVAQTPAVPDLREDCANLEYMKNAHEERIAELQYEAGMYKSLYENAIEQCAVVADGMAAAQLATNEKYPDHARSYATWRSAVFCYQDVAKQIRALSNSSTDRTSK